MYAIRNRAMVTKIWEGLHNKYVSISENNT